MKKFKFTDDIGREERSHLNHSCFSVPDNNVCGIVDGLKVISIHFE